MGVALELDAERLAHGGAAAVVADQVAAGEPPRAFGALDRDLDTVGELLERRDAGREFDGDVRIVLAAVERHAGELVLLALHRERIGRLVLQDAEVELGDDLVRLARSQMRNSGST